MKRYILFFSAIMLASIELIAQAPQGITYQAVARNSAGVEIASQPLTVRIRVRDITATGTIVYSETHSVTTNAFGLFTINIGSGTPVSGAFSGINWSNGAKFLQTEVDFGTGFLDMGTSQLQSVPYALYAEQSGSGGGGGDNWGSQVVQTSSILSGNGTSSSPLTLSQQGASNGQVLKWNGTTWAPAADNNTDAQTLTVSGTTLSISGGNSVTLPTGSGGDNWGTQVVQTDATLTGQGITGNTLKIAQQGASSGQVLKWNGSTWAPAADNNTTYTAGAGISITGTTISATDASATNEIQTLSLSGNTLSLSNGGGSVTLPTGTTYTAGTGITISSNTINSTWTANGTNIFNNNTGNVGIGQNTPTARLDVLGGNWDLSNTEGDFKIGNNTHRLKFGIATSGGGAGDANIGATGGSNRLFLGAGTTTNYLRTLTLTGGRVGVNTITPNQFAQMNIVTSKLYGLLSTSDSSSSNTCAIRGEYLGTTSTDGKGVMGTALLSTPGFGIGVYGEGNFTGGRFFNNGGSYSAATYGVYGFSNGSTGIRYGIYGSASGGTINYGLFCNGNGAYTGTWSMVSDRKFKTNIQPFTNALDKVMQVNVKSFEMKRDEYPSMNFAKGTQFGFIAQELQNVFPELVENGAAPGKKKEEMIEYLGVNYIGLIPVLTKAIQEQQELIKKQQQQIDELYKLLNEKK
jgi:hypothetical protein